MWVLGKKGWVVLVCALLLSANGEGQSLVRLDSLTLFNLANLTGSGISPVRFRLAGDLEYSLSCTNLLFLNWQQGDNANIFSLLHRIRYRSQFSNDRNLKISNSFVHDLGIQYFFDSISRFQPDENTIDTRVEVIIRKNLTFSLLSNLTTRLFNSYLYVTGPNGNLLKTLMASFLTPLQWTFSAGFSLIFPQPCVLTLGLSASKFTWIRDREVYKQQDITEFFGVPQNKRFVLEYGLSMHLLIDKDVLKQVHWNCDVLLFQNFKKPVDLIMKNLVGIRINKFLKGTFQTRLYYEEEVSRRLQVENMVSIGFSFQL